MNSRRSLRGWTLGASAALGALLIAAMVAALAVLWTRHVGERAMDRVAVVVDGDELAEWAAVTGESWQALLRRLRQAGVTGVGVYEWTLDDAALRGELFLVSKATLEAMDSPLALRLPPETPNDALVVGWTEKVDPWLARVLTEELPHVAIALTSEHETEANLWLLTHSNPAHIVLGLHPDDIEAVQSAGLVVIPRLLGGAHESAVRLARRLGAVAGEGFGPVLFTGTSVAGYPASLEHVAKALSASHTAIGLIEFASQLGFGELSKALGYDVVRVHSITDREMAAGISVRHAVDRWVRAVRERQIRLLYVRLYLADQDPSKLTEVNLGYIEELTTALRDAGYRLDDGKPPEEPPGEPIGAPPGAPQGVAPALPPVSLWTLGLIALASGACAGWVAWALFARVTGMGSPAFGGLFWAAIAGVALLTLAAAGALWLKGYTVLARQSLALLAAVCFPVASVCAAARVASGGSWLTMTGLPRADKDGAGPGAIVPGGVASDEAGDAAAAAASAAATAAATAEFVKFADASPSERSPELRITRAIKGFAAALALTFVGASFVAALLSDVRFLLKIEEFRGVKLAHLAPLAAMALMLAAPGAVEAHDRGSGRWRALVLQCREWMNQSIRLWELIAALGVGVILWVYLVRTGNQGLPVLAIEEAFRRLLEENFFARPRTKEFLIGHPALFVALAFWGRYARSTLRWRRFAVHVLLLLGTVGQISILNTFAHAHSALIVSVSRTFYGALLGLVIGVVAVGTLQWLERTSGKGGPPGGPGSRRGVSSVTRSG